MANTIPLDKMSVEEKIQAMESLWDDLCRLKVYYDQYIEQYDPIGSGR